MTPTRNQVVRAAMEKALTPVAIKAPPGMKALDLAAHVIRSTPLERQKVGGISKLYHVLPKQDQAVVLDVVRAVNDERDMGRHGDADGYLKRRGLTHEPDRALIHRVTDAMNTDRVVYELGQRRGTDEGRQLPELTRADVISAAIDAHS